VSANPERDDLRSLPLEELLKRLAEETGTLVRQEIALARAEMQDKAKRAGSGAAMIGAGVVVALMAAGAVTATVILALATAMPGWLAALIVAIVFGLVALFLARGGLEAVKRAMPPIPERSMDKAKEDVRWVKTRARSEKR
jgi:MFS family permease